MSFLEQGLLKGQDFIVFGEDFARHPHSLEHLLRPLFPLNRFIWVETIGMRSPRLTVLDMRRIWEKLRSWVRVSSDSKARCRLQSLVIVAPPMIPLNQFSWVRRFNRWSVRRVVARALAVHSFKRVVTLASVPNAADYVGDFGEILKVYVCVDEFSLWPGLNQALVSDMEQKLIQKSDLVFATSKALAQRKSNGRRETVLLTHGVDYKHFDIGPNKRKSGPLKLCYFGLFDERSDQEIIKAVATQIPNCQLHIFGRVACDVSSLNNLPQLFFHGVVPYRSLPEAIRDMDIFLLPYHLNGLTEAINPLKLKEYLCTGRPIIATPLPEILEFAPYVHIAFTAHDFVEIALKIRRGDLRSDRNAVRTYLMERETWDCKARAFSEQLRNFTCV